LKELIESIDIRLAERIHARFYKDSIRSFLSRINRGEVFAFLVIPAIFLSGLGNPWIVFLFTAMMAYWNDRLVLIIKQKISRKRPSLKVLGKPDNHPDLNHSFPSAHAANSMVVSTILCFEFGLTPILFLLSFMAGVGRLISLHHFLSDVVGGWLIGLGMGFLGIGLFRIILQLPL
jgi:membrane-associated phospholipid phosphatase